MMRTLCTNSCCDWLRRIYSLVMTLLEDTPSFSLWHDPTCTCLYATWQGHHNGGETRKDYDLIYKHLRAMGSTKLLNDSLQDKDGWDQVTDWLANTCFERLADAGLQVVAWVLPQHLGALYDTARVLSQLQRPIVDTFIDAQAAYDWLHHWPFTAASMPAGGIPVTALEFLLLPLNEQMTLIRQAGHPLAPRWEAEFYVKPYNLGEVLLVEAYYYLHSGGLYQIKARPR